MTHKAKSPEAYRVILQQDATEPVNQLFGPVTPEALLEVSVKLLVDHAIDVYASDANHGGGVHYDSKVAERALTSVKELRSGTALQMRGGIEQLIAQGTDPLKVYCEGAHAHGIDYMVRLRMNDLHDTVGFSLNIDKPPQTPKINAPEPYYHTSQWRRDNPGLLMGDPHDDTPLGMCEHYQRAAPNYAFGQVRQYMMAIAEELVNHCDLDVLELDFIRAPFFFTRPERYAQRHVMTEVVRRIAGFCAAAGDRRGRPVYLSARVPDSIEMSVRTGLDVERWITDGLLDMVTISGGYNPFSTPWRDIVSVAESAGIPALACLNHGMFDKDRERIRAAAQRAYDQGASGIKLWNFFYCLDYYHAPEQNPLDLGFTAEIADPEKLKELAKTYGAADSKDPRDFIWSIYDHVTAPGQIPLTVGHAMDDIGHCIEFEIADDPAACADDNGWRLELEIVDVGPEDLLVFAWNTEPIQRDASAWRGRLNNDRHHFEFALPMNACRKGVNQLEIKLVERDARLDPFVTVLEAQIHLPGRSDGR